MSDTVRRHLMVKQGIVLGLLTLLLLLVATSCARVASADSAEGGTVIAVADSPVRVVVNQDQTYQVSFDAGATFSRALPQQTQIKLRYQLFDPLAESELLPIPEALQAAPSHQTYIVQFVSQALAAYQEAITALGGTVYIPLPDQALIVGMDESVKEAVSELPYVRWVGVYHPAYKLEDVLLEELATGTPPGKQRYSIMVLARGSAMQTAVADTIKTIGGDVLFTTPQGYRLEAMLTNEQLLTVAHLSEILFIDRWARPELDMDIVRQTSGANYLESVTGYTGQGVRAEVMDGSLRTTHQNIQHIMPILHGGNSGDGYHGTAVYNIVFGSGDVVPQARGLIPEAQGIFADYGLLGNRYTHTEDLVNPTGPYRTVFQTNSWGGSRTTSYTTVSAEMDDILFQNDIVILQSQSNAGDQMSRPQAWAKNIVSVGGFYHNNTLSQADDAWNFGASIGPAADGRIKPDLAHFYDATYTGRYNSDTTYGDFGGTSGATPITAGHFGLMFQMWADGVFSGGPGQNQDVFDSRPHMTTAKALMINSARQYPFSGTGHDMTRVHQGWGVVDVQDLYDVADANGWNLPLLVDESAVIQPLQIHSYDIDVVASTWLKATMVYADPMGPASATQHRINDLSLRLTSPSGTVYWGNNGLLTGNWSTAGGASNTADTVENVFIETAEIGTWTVEVLADEIVQDGHTETPNLDADYALVVTKDDGAMPITPTPSNTPPPAPTDTPTPTNTPVPPTNTPTPAPPGVIFFDDFESDQGWVVNPGGGDTATTGQWERANPEETTYSGATYQLGTTVSGSNDLVTGGAAGSSVGANDLDGGVTSIRSPNITLPGSGNITLSFAYYLAHYTNGSSDDYLRVTVVGSSSALVLEELAAADVDGATWATHTASLNGFAGQTVYLLIEAADAAGGSLIEAAVDDVQITGTTGSTPTPTNTAVPPTNTPTPTNTPIVPTNTPTATPPPGACVVYTSSDVPISLPNGTASISSVLSVSGSGSIDDLNISIDMLHAWVGDLDMVLTHQDTGTSVTIFDRPGVPASTWGCSNDDILVTLDDEAAVPVENQCASSTPTINGTFSPNNTLSSFDGESGNGTWVLQITDHYTSADAGTLNAWSIEICSP